MHPILFEIGGFPVYTYGLLLAAAYLLGLQFALVRAKARGLNPNRVMDLGIWIIVSALVGAKAMLLIVERDRRDRDHHQRLVREVRRVQQSERRAGILHVRDVEEVRDERLLGVQRKRAADDELGQLIDDHDRSDGRDLDRPHERWTFRRGRLASRRIGRE